MLLSHCMGELSSHSLVIPILVLVWLRVEFVHMGRDKDPDSCNGLPYHRDRMYHSSWFHCRSKKGG